MAPKATVIPVKVLGQKGSGWSSVIARGIVYVADLKAGPLAETPVVINMSLGGSRARRGREGAPSTMPSPKVSSSSPRPATKARAGMGYPGAYQPVISVRGIRVDAVSGCRGGRKPEQLVVRDRRGRSDEGGGFLHRRFLQPRRRAGQDLDVAAPGSWVVGPYQVQSGKTSYFYLSGTRHGLAARGRHRRR